MFHCIFVCAFSFLPRKSAPPADGIPPFRDGNTDSSIRVSSVLGSTPAQSFYSAAGIFPYQSQDHCSIDGIFPLGSNREFNSALGFLPLGGQKFAGTVDVTTLTQK